MGQTGFCEILRFPAAFCENLRVPAVFCENLRLGIAANSRKSKNQQKSAKICEKLQIWLRLSISVRPFKLPMTLNLFRVAQNDQITIQN